MRAYACACIHLYMHACIGVRTFSSMYMRVHVCVFVHFAMPLSIEVGLADFAPPHVELLPTPMH